MVGGNDWKNGFCGIWGWGKGRKDGMGVCVVMEGMDEEDEVKYLLVSLSRGNVKGKEVKCEMERMKKGFDKVLMGRKLKKVIEG